ncbi:hypothetical protein [Aquabacterium sp. A08]|uniref:hypothetical protein n=1 Tax=Aquabacterium sp. A08 TaxID=2718532 RepID=UPI00141D8DA9|nr:hypothetical protein [Aquabacterium sp. A08]NIC43113.1 hypothetical protein [Aquabacterium sp. A08]
MSTHTRAIQGMCTMTMPQLGPRTEKREFPARLLGLSFGGASTGMHMAAKNKPKGRADNVTSIERGRLARLSLVVPEPGWKPRGRYGVMRTREGAELVALNDLVHWMADRDGLTLQQAIAKVLGALQPADLECLHFTQYENPAADPGELREWGFWDAVRGVDRELATPFVDDGSGFTQFARQVPLALMLDERAGIDDNVSPELAAWRAKPEAERRLFLLRERVRIEVAVRAKRPEPEAGVAIAEAFISILATRANKLYGWGAAVNAAPASAPARVLVKDQKPEWTGRRIHERIGELEKQGHASPVAAVVSEVGLSDREVRRRRDAYLKPASPMGRVAEALRAPKKGAA